MNETHTPVTVPDAVFEGIEAVRKSGKTNMLDYHEVMRLAYEGEFYQTVVWMEENKKAYSLGLFAGFVVEEESEKTI